MSFKPRLLAGLGALLAAVGVLLTTAALPPPEESDATREAGSPYLMVWVGAGDRKSSDFLAVLDANPTSESYGRLLTTLPVNAIGTVPHHTEYEFPANGFLLANGWVAGRTFILDVRDPRRPKLAGSFEALAGYSYPHSFVRLPNGNLLATFQAAGAAYAPAGGLVELDERGAAVRSASAAVEGLEDGLIWPYSLEIVPDLDRVVVTQTAMGMPAWVTVPEGSWPNDRIDSVPTRHVQVWQLSDLRLLATLALPESGQGKHHEFPAEPRLLPDGSMYVNTFTCGLYRLTDLDGNEPQAEFVHAFPGGTGLHDECAVPVVVGKFWIQTVPAVSGLVALDISDPAKPVEAARLKLDPRFPMPHWLAADHRGHRVVLTGMDQGYVLIVNIDPQTGAMSVDESFKDEETGAVGVNLSRKRWPHGVGGTAEVHGALFGPR